MKIIKANDVQKKRLKLGVVEDVANMFLYNWHVLHNRNTRIEVANKSE